MVYGPDPPTYPGQFLNAGKSSSVVHGVIHTFPCQQHGSTCRDDLDGRVVEVELDEHRPGACSVRDAGRYARGEGWASEVRLGRIGNAGRPKRILTAAP